MRDKDTQLLEESYDDILLLKGYEDVIEESRAGDIARELLSKLREALSSSSVVQYVGGWLKYMQNLAVIGLSVALASQLFGWLLIGLSRLLDRNVKAKKEAREALYKIAYGKEIENLSEEEDLSTEEMYEIYLGLQDRLAAELDEKYPIRGRERWSMVLNSVGRTVKDRIGTAALALAGIYAYTRIADVPVWQGGGGGSTYTSGELGTGNTQIYKDMANFEKPTIPHFGSTSKMDTSGGT